MILLDTNVVSETFRPKPDIGVVRWLNTHTSECAISSIAIFELRLGIAKLARGKRRDMIEQLVERAIRRFAGRIYSFDVAAAESSANLFARARSAGRGLHQVPEKLSDLQTAGIAIANGLRLATRNTSDFGGLGLDLIDPWKA